MGSLFSSPPSPPAIPVPPPAASPPTLANPQVAQSGQNQRAKAAAAAGISANVGGAGPMGDLSSGNLAKTTLLG